MPQISVERDQLALWCRERLGAEPERELFHNGYLSAVVGVRLVDGRDVVVKVRPGHPRLKGCFEVQTRVFQAGFPCPEPILGPSPFGEWWASVEGYRPGGTPLPSSGRAPERFAAAFARLMAAAPAPREVAMLGDPPPWTMPTRPGSAVWPTPDDSDIDLNATDGPRWLDDLAARLQDRLSEAEGSSVVGHGDFYAGNLRWSGDQLHAVHDWDSVIAAPEPVLVGLAAAVFPSTGGPGQEATIDETQRFLVAYQQCRDREFSPDEIEQAWAAGLWVRAFDAKKQFASTRGTAALGEGEAGMRRRLARL